MSLEFSRLDALDLLRQWTKSLPLRRHGLAVEAAMRAYAPHFRADVELWGQTGLLHDLDYEQYPDPETGHPRYAIKELSGRGYPLEMLHAIASHAEAMGVPRESSLDRCLYAVDEISGFIVAVSHIHPKGLEGLTARTVFQKLRTKSFARAVDRGEIIAGAEALGIDVDEHIEFVVKAIVAVSEELLAEGSEEWRVEERHSGDVYWNPDETPRF